MSLQPYIIVIDDYFPPQVEPLHFDELIAEDHVRFDLEGEADISCFMARPPRPSDTPAETSQEESTDSEPAEPSSPYTFQDGEQGQSVQVYDLHSNYARGRARVRPLEAFFADARPLLGHGHHEVAAIFAVTVPRDLHAAQIKPLLLMLHDDIIFGNNRAAVLIDVELHGSTWEDPIETDRYTTQLPAQIHRSMLLRIAGVERYCQISRNRCLVWHQGNLVPLQRQAILNLQQGDYVRIAVPPFLLLKCQLTMLQELANMACHLRRLFSGFMIILIRLTCDQNWKLRRTLMMNHSFCSSPTTCHSRTLQFVR